MLPTHDQVLDDLAFFNGYTRCELCAMHCDIRLSERQVHKDAMFF